MRGITLGLFSYIPTVYDTDFQTNVLDVAQVNEFEIPPISLLREMNWLMKGMKNIGFYQIQDTLANFALGISGYEQFRMIDWKQTGNIYTPYGGLIYNSNGIEGNGIDGYINTNFNPATMGQNYTLNDASLGNVIYKNATGGHSNINVSFSNSVSGTAGNLIRNDNSTIKRLNQSSINLSSSIDFRGEGLKVLNRINDEELIGISKDVETVSRAESSEIYDSNLFLLVRQDLYSLLGLSLVFAGASISYEQSQSFRAIYNKFLSNVGLNPIS